VVALNRGVFSAIPRGGIHPERFSSFGIDWWATKSPALAGWAPRIGPPGMADTDGSLKLPLLADRRGISILGLAANESARAYPLYFILPLWIAAGICDRFAGRARRIAGLLLGRIAVMVPNALLYSTS
jgi:hypothetical protein